MFPAIDEAYIAYHTRIKTATLNDVVLDAYSMFPPSIFNGGKIKIYYASQVGVEPPTLSDVISDIDNGHNIFPTSDECWLYCNCIKYNIPTYCHGFFGRRNDLFVDNYVYYNCLVEVIEKWRY